MRYLCSLFLFFCFQSMAQQVVFVKKDAAGLANGTSWANAYTSLSAALSAAPSKAELWVAKGTYTPGFPASADTCFRITKGVSIFGGFAGTESAKSGRNVANNPTLLSAEGITTADNDNFSIVLKVDGPKDSVIIDGCTITRTQQKSYQNAALTAHKANIRMENCLFQNNMPASLGSAMVQADSGSLYLRNTNFTNNAGKYSTLISVLNNPLKMDNCLFEGNITDGFGILNHDNPTSPLICRGTTFRNNAKAEIHILSKYAFFQNCTFENHSASSSYLVFDSGSDSLVLDGCNFFNNQAKSPQVYCHDAHIRNCTFKNGADNAIYNSGGDLQVQNTTFDGFAGGSGGAIYCFNGIFTQCTFTNNFSGIGGAIYAQYLTIDGSSFLNNSVGQGTGGAVYSANNFTIRKSTFKNNIGGQAGAVFGSKGTISESHFENNMARYSGGAVYSFDSSTFESSIFLLNGTPDTSSSGPYSSGGAIYCGGHTAIFNSFFQGNSAYNGAAVQAGGQSVFVNVTCVDNKSPVDSSNGALTYSDTIQVVNCIFWNQTTEELVSDYIGTKTVSYSIVKGGAAGTANTSSDPMLDAHGVPLAGSLAIDKGTTTNLWTPVALDAGGSPRIVHSKIDIGAFEYQGVPNSLDAMTEVLGLSIYPNPVSQQADLTIEALRQTDFVEGVFYNLLGIQVAKVSLQGTLTRFNCASLSVGNYVLVLTKKNGEKAYAKIAVN